MLTLLLLVSINISISPSPVNGIARKFYIAVVEDYWDYMPEANSSRVPFKKAMYKAFTDETFTVEEVKHDWLGFIGPTLFAEEGDVLDILFFNNASIPYSMHPHGLLYGKNHEGALYDDGYHGNSSVHTKDIVRPGDTFRYVWLTTQTASPADGDPDCLSYIYHSHVNTPKDVNSGLVGFLLACRKGTLNGTIGHTYYSIYVSTFDESDTWYYQENRRNNATASGTSFPALNGFINGTMPNLTACVGQTVIWHFASLGTYNDLHALSLSGHTFTYFDKREQYIDVSTGQFATATTTSLYPGKWLLSCAVNKYVKEGMLAYYDVQKCRDVKPPRRKKIQKIRRHYIAAEEVIWNYAPTGTDVINGQPLNTPGSYSYKHFNNKTTFGGVYKKAIFRAYDDYHFKTKKVQDDRPEHLGILGPVIRAEVGDLVEVVFKNMASRPYSLHAEGVAFSKKSEGLPDSDTGADNQVAPGGTYTYFWKIPEVMAPTSRDPQCLTRAYMSGVNIVKDTMSGLIGPLLVCKPGTLDRDGKQLNIAKEFILLFAVFHEKDSWYLEENFQRAKLQPKHLASGSADRNSINGLMYGNLQGLEMCLADTVFWHILTVGDRDLHSVHFHGNVFSLLGTHRASLGILPGARTTLRMIPDEPGLWKLDCLIYSHLVGGESTLYRVKRCGRRPGRLIGATKRTVYLQAEEIDWDYAPTNKDLIFDGEIPFFTYYRKYRKIVYREYTDRTFSKAARREDEQYLGILGPIIRVEEGDILRIVFRNKGQWPFSVNPLGLTYRAGGSFREDGMQDQPSVLPGKTFTFEWDVRKDAGPGHKDNNCTSSVYYSDANIIRDLNSGLLGPLVICRKGVLDKRGRRRDVSKDFAIYFNLIDEGQNWLVDGNMKRCKAAAAPECVATKYVHINGYIFGNGPVPTMDHYTSVDWYVLTMGNHSDYHPVHFHGNDFYVFDGKTHVSDVSPMVPGTFSTIRMFTFNAGKWLFHCHTNSHIKRGMEGMYIVEPSNNTADPLF